VTWASLALAFAVSFVFSGIEAGILSVNRVRLRHHVNQGDPAAIKLNRLLARPERLLVTVLIVRNLMNLWALVLLAGEFARACSGLGRWGVPAGFGATFLVAFPIFAFGLEALPKAIFRRFPYRALAALSEVLRIADLALSPLLWIGGAAARILKPEETPAIGLFAGREDFRYLAIESERGGALTADERKMIENVIDLRAVTARDVMVPFAQALSVPDSMPVDAFLSLAHKRGAERFPVVSSDGEPVGLVSALDVLLDRGHGRRVATFQRRLLAVAPGEPASRVLRKLRAARLPLALVREGAGPPLGVVSVQDVVMRLVDVATAAKAP
jgi:CBS domain containing-hemolysin-like protein